MDCRAFLGDLGINSSESTASIQVELKELIVQTESFNIHNINELIIQT